ncbi:pseudouridine synthase [Syncephalastrum racemosum]|uniref:tRNA pseudouridine synthase n=1 Tax=Syncephalastrum racemosum TaxID=13706 RepID=A0A1X2HQ93_SYNRA|nr:pseudouridine synthase [Syncephalastrum racemosum]
MWRRLLGWYQTHRELRDRIACLETQLAAATVANVPKQPRSIRPPSARRSKSLQRIAFKVAYVGWPFYGFARHANEEQYPTVQGRILEALQETRLEHDPDTFSLAGRTDTGVSGVGQVVALDMQANVPYLDALNRFLPDTIRLMAWAPVSPTFNARLDCRSRTYRYYLDPLTARTLDVAQMQRAADFFLGKHDFSAFCRFSPSQKHHIRSITAIRVRHDHVEIKAPSFLWHQVRCMMSILFLIGQGFESPLLVCDLLDAKLKRDYPLADPRPLVLHSCEYNPPLVWQAARQPQRLFQHWGSYCSEQDTHAWIARACLESIQPRHTGKAKDGYSVVLGAGRSLWTTKRYTPVQQRRATEDYQSKRKKLSKSNKDDEG